MLGQNQDFIPPTTGVLWCVCVCVVSHLPWSPSMNQVAFADNATLWTSGGDKHSRNMQIAADEMWHSPRVPFEQACTSAALGSLFYSEACGSNVTSLCNTWSCEDAQLTDTMQILCTQAEDGPCPKKGTRALEFSPESQEGDSPSLLLEIISQVHQSQR